MKLRVGDIELLLALFQAMGKQGYKPLNPVTGLEMETALRDLRHRIEHEYEMRAYRAGRNA